METIIASLLMSLFSNIANMSIAKRDRDTTYQRQIELLEKQNQYNTEMFNKTNEYNEPTNQLNRLMRAGASAGGAFSMLGNQTANSIGSSTTPSVAGLNPGLANMFSDFGQKAAELSNLKADTRVKNAEANRNETTLYFDISKTKAEVDKLAGQLNLTNEQTDNLKILNKYADLKSQEEINEIITNIKLTQQQIANAKEEEKKQIWENFYRNNFGIDPNSNYMNQIITSSLKGDMPAVFGAFEKTANFVFSKLNDAAKQGFEKLSNKLGIPIDENGKLILNGSKYLNTKPTLVNIMSSKSNGNHFRNPKNSTYYKMNKEMIKHGKGITQW